MPRAGASGEIAWGPARIRIDLAERASERGACCEPAVAALAAAAAPRAPFDYCNPLVGELINWVNAPAIKNACPLYPEYPIVESFVQITTPFMWRKFRCAVHYIWTQSRVIQDLKEH